VAPLLAYIAVNGAKGTEPLAEGKEKGMQKQPVKERGKGNLAYRHDSRRAEINTGSAPFSHARAKNQVHNGKLERTTLQASLPIWPGETDGKITKGLTCGGGKVKKKVSGADRIMGPKNGKLRMRRVGTPRKTGSR